MDHPWPESDSSPRARRRRRAACSATLGLLTLLALLSGCGDDDGDADGSAEVTTPESGGPDTESPVPPEGDTTGPEDDTGLPGDDNGLPEEVTGTEAADPCQPARPGVTDPDRTFDDGGGERVFRLAVPSDDDGATPRPVLVDLHGLQSNAVQEAALTGFESTATALGYVVVTPNGARPPGSADATSGPAGGSGQFWDITMDDNADVAYLEALLDELESELCLDTDHVYATGMSNGGGMSAVLACLSKRFAAVVPVAGLNINSGCRPDRALPVVAIHGDADSVVRYDAAITVPEAMAEYAAAAGCDAEPTTTTLFDDVEHRVWNGCAAPVELYTVLGGGHTWPGRDLVDLAANAADDGSTGDSTPGESAPGPASRFTPEQLAEILGHMTTNIDASQIALDTFEAHRHAADDD